jgi:hypothetical protein
MGYAHVIHKRTVGGVVMVFDVALWLFWPSLFPEYIAIIEAPDPLSAVFVLMESCEVYRVSLAAVRLPDGSLRRWFGVRCPTGEQIA